MTIQLRKMRQNQRVTAYQFHEETKEVHQAIVEGILFTWFGDEPRELQFNHSLLDITRLERAGEILDYALGYQNLRKLLDENPPTRMDLEEVHLSFWSHLFHTYAREGRELGKTA